MRNGSSLSIRSWTSSFGAAGEADFAPELRLARNLGRGPVHRHRVLRGLGPDRKLLTAECSRAIRYSPSRISSSANSMSSSASATALRQDRTGSSPKLSSATHSRLWGKSNDLTGPDQDKGRSPSRGPHGNTGIPGDRILQIERTRAPAMHSQSIQQYQHPHVFLGETHERNERKTWTVIAICTAMMLAEIVGGVWFGSVALLADGLHMSTHAGALLIAAMAYTYSRRYARDERLSFGTGKLGDLAAFTSAIALAMIALLIGYESLDRFFHPVSIAFNQAIPIAGLGLGINLLSAFLLRDDHDHHDAHSHDHDDDHADDESDHALTDSEMRGLSSRPQSARRICACDGRCCGFGVGYHRPCRRTPVWLDLDGSGRGSDRYSRHHELVLQFHSIGRCGPARCFS